MNAFTNMESLCFILGWQGGTLRQVADALSTTESDILNADNSRMHDLAREAQSVARATVPEASAFDIYQLTPIVGTPKEKTELERLFFKAMCRDDYPKAMDIWGREVFTDPVIEAAYRGFCWGYKERASEPVSGWQPIETAPTDEAKSILVWCAGNRCTYVVTPELDGWMHFGGGFGRYLEHKPTHWQPIPEAPRAIEQEQSNNE
jgi:hypothetical protein